MSSIKSRDSEAAQGSDPILDNPFPGLRPFEESDSSLFFGRENQIAQLLQRLGENHFLAIIGVSGSGKSSLVRAGLIPYLYQGFLPSTGTQWKIAIFRPGDSPALEMAKALEGKSALGKRHRGKSISELLHAGDRGLREAASELGDDDNLLIVVDQFEEIFRFKHLTSSEKDRAQAVDNADDFVRLLLNGLIDDRVHIVITMRSEFLGDCAQFRDLPEKINQGQYLIPRLSHKEQKQIIRGPVLAQGAQISETLVDRLLADVGPEPQQLPVLQHALMRTWDHWVRSGAARPIDESDYEAVGGFEDALNRHAGELYRGLASDEQRWIAGRLFRRITLTDQSGRVVRDPTKLKDLLLIAGAVREPSNAVGKAVLEVIRYYQVEGINFLTSPSGSDLTEESVVDITHESLCRLWNDLERWVREEAESARAYERVAQLALEYNKKREGLYTDPGLSAVLEKYRPLDNPPNRDGWNPLWSRRYPGDFTLTQFYLRKSKRTRDFKIARLQLTSVVIASLTVLLLATAYYLDTMVAASDAAALASQAAAYRSTLGSYGQERAALATIASYRSWPSESNSDLGDWEFFEHITRPSALFPNAQGAVQISVSEDNTHIIANKNWPPPDADSQNTGKVIEPQPRSLVLKADSLVADDQVLNKISDPNAVLTANGKYAGSFCTEVDGNWFHVIRPISTSTGLIKLECEPSDQLLSIENVGTQVFTHQRSGNHGTRICAFTLNGEKILDQTWKDRDPKTLVPSPDGKYVSVGFVIHADSSTTTNTHRDTVHGRDVSMVELLKHEQGRLIAVVPQQEVASQFPAAFSHNSDYFALGTARNCVSLYKLRDSAVPPERIGDCSDEVTAIAFHPKKDEIAFANFNTRENKLRMVNIEPRRVMWSDYFARPLQQLAFSPNGLYLGLAVGENTARVLDAQTGFETVRTTHEDVVLSVAFDRNSQFMVSLDKGGNLARLPASHARAPEFADLDCFSGAVALGKDLAIAFCKSQEELDAEMRLTNSEWAHVAAKAGAWVFFPNGPRHPFPLQSLADVPYPPSHSASAGLDHLLPPSQRSTIRCPIALSANGLYAASACDSKIKVYKIGADNGEQRQIGDERSWADLLKLDTRVRSGDGSARYSDNAMLSVATIALSVDGNMLAIGDVQGNVLVVRGFAEATGTPWTPVGKCSIDDCLLADHVPQQHGDEKPAILALAFSHDVHPRLAIGTSDGDIWVRKIDIEKAFDGDPGDLAWHYSSHNDVIGVLKFSPDGDFLALGSGSFARVVRVQPNWWSWKRWHLLNSFWKGKRAQPEEISHVSHGNMVKSMAFSADRAHVASGDIDGVVMVFRALPLDWWEKSWSLVKFFFSRYGVYDRPEPNMRLTWEGTQHRSLMVYDVQLNGKGGEELVLAADKNRVWDEPSEKGAQTLQLSRHQLVIDEARYKEICHNLSLKLQVPGMDYRKVCALP